MSKETIVTLVEQYLASLAQREYSQNTIVSSRRLLGIFSEWCEIRGITKPHKVTKHTISRYERWTSQRKAVKTGKPLSVYAKSNRLSAVRTFFTWLSKEGFVLYNPAGDMELPKVPRRLPRNYLNIEEVEKIFSVIDVEDDLGLRNRAMMEVLYSTGMRKMEMCSLKIKEIDFSRGMIFIIEGKGKKDRVVPVGKRALDWVERYIAEVRPSLVKAPDDGTVFLSNHGKSMYEGGISNIVRKYIKLAGIEKKGACHLFRHTCATLMLEGGADIRYIQELLGHEHLSTTQIYTQVAIKKLKEVHEETHPARR